MRQSLLLLAAAATASAQTRITNWEEQHQRFVRQAAFEDLLSWFRATSASRGAAAVSRHLHDSSPGMMEVGGLFFDVEAVRTTQASAASTPGRERLHGLFTEDLGRGRVHGDVDGRQGRRRRFVIGAAGRRGPVREGG